MRYSVLVLLAPIFLLVSCEQKDQTPNQDTDEKELQMTVEKILERESPDPDTPSPTVIQVYDKLNFGNGYNSSTGEEYFGVLDFDGTANATEVVGNVRGNRGRITVHNVTSKEDFKSILNISAEAELDFQLGSWKSQNNLKLSTLQETEFNDFMQHVVVKANYANEPITIIEPKVRKELIELAQKDPDAFMRSCGDMFVSRIYTGGELYMTYSMSQRDKKEKTTNEAFFKTVNQVGSAQIDVTATAKSVDSISSSVKDLTTTVITEGGAATPTGSNVEDFLKYASDFKEDVSADKRAVILYVELSPYENIAGFPDIDFSKIRKTQRLVLERVGQRLSFLRQDKDNADFVLERYKYFTVEDSLQAEQVLRRSDSTEMVLKKILTDCRRNPDYCDLDDLSLVADNERYNPQIILPAYNGIAKELPLTADGTWVRLTDVTSADDPERLAIDGRIEIRSSVKDDPDCRQPTYQKVRTSYGKSTYTTGALWWVESHTYEVFVTYEYPYYEVRYLSNSNAGTVLRQFRYETPIELEKNVAVEIRLVNPNQTIIGILDGRVVYSQDIGWPKFPIIQNCGDPIFGVISDGTQAPKSPEEIRQAQSGRINSRMVNPPSFEKDTSTLMEGIPDQDYYYDWEE